MYICFTGDFKIHVPTLAAEAGAQLPADLVALRAAREADSVTDLNIRLSEYRAIVKTYALVYKHASDGWCCTCPTFLRDAVCAHDRTWCALLRLVEPPSVDAPLSGGVRGRPAAGSGRGQAGADARAARRRRVAAPGDVTVAADAEAVAELAEAQMLAPDH